MNVYVADLRNCAGQVSRAHTDQVCRQQCYKLDVSQFCRWTSFRNTACSNLPLSWRDTHPPTSMASAGKDFFFLSFLFLSYFLSVGGWLLDPLTTVLWFFSPINFLFLLLVFIHTPAHRHIYMRDFETTIHHDSDKSSIWHLRDIHTDTHTISRKDKHHAAQMYTRVFVPFYSSCSKPLSAVSVFISFCL